MLSGKVWGSTEVICRSPFCEMHYLVIKPNSRCSLHRHQFKHNVFFIIQGRLFIEAHKLGYDLVDITELGPGQKASIPPVERHMFVTKDEGCVAIELYHPEPIGEDIIRENVGGRVKRVVFAPKTFSTLPTELAREQALDFSK